MKREIIRQKITQKKINEGQKHSGEEITEKTIKIYRIFLKYITGIPRDHFFLAASQRWHPKAMKNGLSFQ